MFLGVSALLRNRAARRQIESGGYSAAAGAASAARSRLRT
jgi:hypothetical protein